MKKKVIIIGGPTASGKTKLALDLATDLRGEVINADSMQVYKDTPVLAATPDENEKKIAPHHLFEIYESDFRGNVVDWLNLCIAKIREIWGRGNLPIVVGGTGMYLQNLIQGTTPIPPTKPEIREKVYKEYESSSLAEMYQKLQQIDEKTAKKISINDKTRILRAIEVYEDTGIPISKWYEQPMKQLIPEAEFFIIKLEPPLRDLEHNCHKRFELMLEKGAFKEVINLSKKDIDSSCPAMKALGVPELLRYIKGEIDLREAISLANLHTRQYAKRQLTWFRHQMEADFVLKMAYSGQKNVVEDIENSLQNSCTKKD